MVWGPTAFEVPHRPSITGQSGWNESLPAGNMQVKSSARIFRDDTLNVTDLQSVCHWIVTLGIIRAVQKLFRGGLCLATPCVMPTKWPGAIVGLNALAVLIQATTLKFGVHSNPRCSSISAVPCRC